MAATYDDIKSWLKKGREGKDITHMVVVCDTFDWEDYPVYVRKSENVRDIYCRHDGPNMQKVMEVYSYQLSLENQLCEQKAFHFD